MANEIVLKLPDGMAKVLTPEAQQTVERLWYLGRICAAICAVRILEALEATELLRKPLLLNEREAGAARQVLDVKPQPPSLA
jgi:hypothetical protein